MRHATIALLGLTLLVVACGDERQHPIVRIGMSWTQVEAAMGAPVREFDEFSIRGRVRVLL